MSANDYVFKIFNLKGYFLLNFFQKNQADKANFSMRFKRIPFFDFEDLLK